MLISFLIEVMESSNIPPSISIHPSNYHLSVYLYPCIYLLSIWFFFKISCCVMFSHRNYSKQDYGFDSQYFLPQKQKDGFRLEKKPILF